jgi:hypothetical protein
MQSSPNVGPSSWFDDFKDVGDDPEFADSLNCGQIVALGRLGLWPADICNDLLIEQAPTKCCYSSETVATGPKGKCCQCPSLVSSVRAPRSMKHCFPPI